MVNSHDPPRNIEWNNLNLGIKMEKFARKAMFHDGPLFDGSDEIKVNYVLI